MRTAGIRQRRNGPWTSVILSRQPVILSASEESPHYSSTNQPSLKACRDGAADLSDPRRSFLCGKDAHSPAFCQERDHPLRYDEESVRESNQEIDVYNRPDKPCQESCEAQFAKIGDRISASYNRKVALVPVAEGFRRCLPSHTPPNQACHVLAFLNGRLSNARHDHCVCGFHSHQVPRRSNHVGRVPNRENI